MLSNPESARNWTHNGLKFMSIRNFMRREVGLRSPRRARRRRREPAGQYFSVGVARSNESDNRSNGDAHPAYARLTAHHVRVSRYPIKPDVASDFILPPS